MVSPAAPSGPGVCTCATSGRQARTRSRIARIGISANRKSPIPVGSDGTEMTLLSTEAFHSGPVVTTTVSWPRRASAPVSSRMDAAMPLTPRKEASVKCAILVNAVASLDFED
ncbi:hypothetical protein V6V89_24400 [Micromonospora sp. CPCC 206061]